jgi:hypothetical protein
MERDERKPECDQLAQDIPRWLGEFWGNQLQRVKRRAEGQAIGMSSSSTSDAEFRLPTGCGGVH